MPEDTAQNENHRALFANLVMMLSTSAMQQLGSAPNPLTDQVEVDLDGAQMSIDMIEMLQARMAVSLDKGEQRMLNHVLSDLRMLYVEAAKAPPAGAAGQADAQAAPKTADGDIAEPPVVSDAAPPGDSRFHKSYG